jgi:hypothetical protein
MWLNGYLLLFLKAYCQCMAEFLWQSSYIQSYFSNAEGC